MENSFDTFLVALSIAAAIALIAIPFQLARLARALEHRAGLARTQPRARYTPPPMVIVEPAGTGTYLVRVQERGRETRHEVTVSPEDLERLGAPGERPEDFVHRCFDFLLAREPKESILREFDVSAISTYFPDFEEVIRAG